MADIKTVLALETSYALDDSCQMTFWARGHWSWGEFFDAVRVHLDENNRDDIPAWVVVQANVKQTYQRTVPIKGNIVGDNQIVYQDNPGRGASPVTVMEFWFPIHKYTSRAVLEAAQPDQPSQEVE